MPRGMCSSQPRAHFFFQENLFVVGVQGGGRASRFLSRADFLNQNFVVRNSVLRMPLPRSFQRWNFDFAGERLSNLSDARSQYTMEF
jgi:hypothetical protein